MQKQSYKTYVLIVFFGFTLYLIQKTGAYLLKIDTRSFSISLELLHFIFCVFSCLFLLLLDFVFKTDKTAVGKLFLRVTLIKTVFLIYFIKTSIASNSIEEFNFMALFIAYLTLETYCAVKKLNTISF